MDDHITNDCIANEHSMKDCIANGHSMNDHSMKNQITNDCIPKDHFTTTPKNSTERRDILLCSEKTNLDSPPPPIAPSPHPQIR